MSDTLIQPVTVDPVLDEGDHDRFTHIVPKAELADAMINGTPIQALCGKVWVPSRDPERYPVCIDCIAEWERVTGNVTRGEE